MMKDFEIKIFAPEHIPEAAEIESLCFSEPWSESALSYMCTSQNTRAVAVIDKECGRLAAYGGAQYILDEANIVNIATHPDYRRRGCATAVMHALEAFFKENGIEYVYLEVRKSNASAQALYTKEGYAPCGIIKNDYRFPAEDAVEMFKKLN
jgi:ribosomal-protein-alanine N-acetyltransferase